MKQKNLKQQTWQTYEEVARFLLNRFKSEFNLDRVEPKQHVAGASGTSWEIDAKGVKENDSNAIILVECRQYRNKKLNQEALAGLAFRITDTGASGGIIITPLPLQSGAEKVSKASNIISVRLGTDSTPENFVLGFFNKIFIGVTDAIQITESVSVVITDKHGKKKYI